MQLACHRLGGRVVPSNNREYGHTRIKLRGRDPIFEKVPPQSVVWMSHGDVVKSGGKSWKALAYSDNGLLCAVRHRKLPIHALQFHPEVAHTRFGQRMLKNFLFKVCRCKGDWKMASFARRTVQEIRRRVGKEQVICALSGGVDSTVVATLIRRAIGRRLTCVFVNNGLLRKDEHTDLLKLFRKRLKFNVEYVDAEKRFLNRLKGVRQPERKRRIIGHDFIRIFERVARRKRGIRFLAQGTLYPDLIESVSAHGGPTAKIKTHHNVGGLPKDLKFELIEPLKFVFKDEVRRIAQELRIPKSFWRRQPFPGPGLAVRLIGEITRPKLDLLREADAIVREEIEAEGLHQGLWQYFAVLLPARSVGVMGDARTYESSIAVRIVESQDGMTADWAKLPHPVLGRISSRITNEVKGINRVVLDMTSKPPGTIEWE
jgi:GMP synthase (glutamine-hydrolysing)